MKIKHLSLTVIVATFLSIGSVFAQGGQDSGGIDLKSPGSTAAWFLGNEPVSVCIDVAADFGVTPEFAREQVTLAIDQWVEYYQTHMWVVPVGYNLDLATNFRIQPTCLGGEDLRILFGTESNEINSVRAHFHNPMGFAHRETYSPMTGRGRGFIWIRKGYNHEDGRRQLNWSKEGTLLGILLHEVGHVFGTGHVTGTIMDDSLLTWKIFWWLSYDRGGEWTIKDRAERLYKITHIDSTRFLLPPLTTTSQYSGTQISEPIFVQLMGRNSVGAVQSIFSFFSETPDVMSLTIKDSLSERTIPIPMMIEGMHRTVVSPESAVFEVYWHKDNGETFTAGRESVALTLFTQISDAHGALIPVVVQYGHIGKVLIQTMGANGPQVIFEAKIE